MRYKTEDGWVEEVMVTEVERYVLDQLRKGASMTLFIQSDTKEEAKSIRDAAPIKDTKDDNEGRGYYSASQFINGKKSLLTILSRYKKSHSAAKQ